MLTGDELNNQDVQKQYGISNDHTVSDVATRLRNEGYSVIKDERTEKNANGRPVRRVYWRVDSRPVASKQPAKTSKQPANVSERIRQHLLQGDGLSAKQVADKYGVSRSLLGVVVTQMRREGLIVNAERIAGGQAVLRLADPDTTPVATKKPKAKSRKAIYADLARRFEDGERIDAHIVMNDYGVNSLLFLGGFLNAQRKKGWAFTKTGMKTEDGWRTTYRLKHVDPKKAPAWVDEVPPEEPEPEQAQVIDVTDQPLNPVPPDLPPLAIQVSVVIHLWDPETGGWSLGLSNGKTSWLIPVAHQ